MAAGKDGEDPVGTGQFKNESQLAIEAAQVQLPSMFSYPLKRRHQGAESAAVHEFDILAINQEVLGLLGKNGANLGSQVSTVLGVNEASGPQDVEIIH